MTLECTKYIVTNPPDFSGLSRFLASNPWLLILALKILRNVPLQSGSLTNYNLSIKLMILLVMKHSV